MIIWIILAAVCAYLLGSINSSILVGRVYGKDIREYGSKNAGLTNTMRVLGKKAAVFVLMGDIVKGIAACLIADLIIPDLAFTPYAVGGLFAVIGHNWPVYFEFKGGKGALTAVAVAFMIDPAGALILLGIFLTVLLLFRYVSLATITTGIFYPLISYLTTGGIYIPIYALVLAVMIIFRHRSNIKRLLNGEESKIDSRLKIG